MRFTHMAIEERMTFICNKRMEFEIITLSKINQTQKHKHHAFSVIVKSRFFFKALKKQVD